MKKTIIILCLFLVTLNLTAQRYDYKIVESRTFDTLKVTLKKLKVNDEYVVSFNIRDVGLICDTSFLSEFIYAFKEADTRKGFHTFIRTKSTSNGERVSIMVRHSKKSDYIGIGHVYEFQSGYNKIVYRKNAQALISYLEEIRSIISCP